MNTLFPAIQEIAERIRQKEERRKRLAHFLRSVARPTGLVTPLLPAPLDGVRIVGVDGGLVKKSLQGMDCMLSRAVAACFSYEKNRIAGVEYVPSASPAPEPALFESASEVEWLHYSSLRRQHKEVQTALDAIRKFKPTAILMDGSLLPHPADRPTKGSPVAGEYRNLLQDLQQLYTAAREQGVLLAGVIEDSRSRRFCDYVSASILPGIPPATAAGMAALLTETADTSLLFWVLEQGERTRLFPVADGANGHPLVGDIGEWAGQLFTLYLKTASLDRPVRVEVLVNDARSPVEEADQLARLLLSVSGQHAGYGLPAPLIEADNRAKIAEAEMEQFYLHVISLVGMAPSVMRLRREQRPF